MHTYKTQSTQNDLVAWLSERIEKKGGRSGGPMMMNMATVYVYYENCVYGM